MRFALAGEMHTQESIGIFAVLHDLAGHQFDALYVLDAADQEGAFALFLQQPLAADVKTLLRHDKPPCLCLIRPPDREEVESDCQPGIHKRAK
jgi:hypothetical protein